MLRGGAEIQASDLMRSFANMGCETVISSNPRENLSHFNLVHVSGLYNADLLDNCLQYKDVHLFIKTLVYPGVTPLPIRAQEYLDRAIGIQCESPIEANFLNEKFNTTKKTHITLPSVLPIFAQKADSMRLLVHSNGRYGENKNHKLILEICKSLNLPVVVAGFVYDYNYFMKCRQVAWGTVYGDCNAQQICQILRQTKVYVCASKIEICSGSVCEAIASGCLVLSSTTHIGNTHFTQQGYHTYDTPEELSKKLIQIYNSNEIQQNRFWVTDDLTKHLLKIWREYASGFQIY